LAFHASRRADAYQVFKPFDSGRKVKFGGDLDQLQKVPLQPAFMTGETFVPDGQVRRLSPLRLTDRTEEALPSTPKAQGGGDPKRISGGF